MRLIACFAASVGGGSSAGHGGGSSSAALQQLDLSSIPESLDEMIAAQIDALPPDLQLLLKMVPACSAAASWMACSRRQTCT